MSADLIAFAASFSGAFLGSMVGTLIVHGSVAAREQQKRVRANIDRIQNEIRGAKPWSDKVGRKPVNDTSGDTQKILNGGRLARAVVAGFTYDPGHSDLDDEQSISVRMTLGDYRRAMGLAR